LALNQAGIFYQTTSKSVVNRIITNLGVLDVVPVGFKIVECANGVTIDQLRAATEAAIVGWINRK
jgi:3-oxoacid CoA-transferase subunit B